MRRTLLATLLLACNAEAPEAEPTEAWAPEPVFGAALDPFLLEIGTTVPGEPTPMTVTGANNGTLVKFLVARNEGAGPCLPSGDCLDLVGPKLIGQAIADSSFTATATWNVPLLAPLGLPVSFQAFMQVPETRISPTIPRVINRTAIFYDEFEGSGFGTGWALGDEGITSGTPNFHMRDGQAQEDGQAIDIDTGEHSDKGVYLWNRATTMVDGVIRADVRADANGTVGIVYGVQPDGLSYYRLTINDAHGFLRLSRSDNGEVIHMATTHAYDPPVGSPIRVRIIREGTGQEIWIDNLFEIVVSHDPVWMGGSVGLYSRGSTDARWDFLRIDERPPNCGDGIEDADEECDDGNLDFGDGCDTVCALE